MEDYGELQLDQINSEDFWCLFDELCNDNSEFLNNRSTMVEAYKNGRLYGLRVNETEQMYKRGAIMDILFCDNTFYLLPCFCIKENNTAVIIWTHTRARHMGFAKKLVELLQIEYAYNPLPDSIEFWKKCNVQCKAKLL